MLGDWKYRRRPFGERAEMKAPVLERNESLLKPTLETEASKTVCFVCTGNTCRSPMAEAVTNHLAKKHGKAIRATSAGLYAVSGDAIASNAVRALENANIIPSDTRDYRLHTAHTVCAEEAERFLQAKKEAEAQAKERSVLS